MSIRAADDFDAIRQRLGEIQAERQDGKRCKGGCGEPRGGIHKSGCGFSGRVTESECG